MLGWKGDADDLGEKHLPLCHPMSSMTFSLKTPPSSGASALALGGKGCQLSAAKRCTEKDEPKRCSWSRSVQCPGDDLIGNGSNLG